MIRKAIIVVLTLAAVIMLFLRVWATPDRILLRYHPKRYEWMELRSDWGKIGLLLQWKRRFIRVPRFKRWDFEVPRFRRRYFAGADRCPDFVMVCQALRFGGVDHNTVRLGMPVRRLPVLSLVFALYPTLALIRGVVRNRRRWRRRRLGLCFRCGYNLTGNVSGVCPECGTKIEP
ncbi:MAG: hypothetical protein JSU86_16275 [Phycisphaerales bacterium]|nr:MAG: hypothetical protein JSU86_16275 [Phycisphaerales bacterium]